MKEQSIVGQVTLGGCFDTMAMVEAMSVNLIISDWDYFTAPAFGWHRPYSTMEEYLAWIGDVCREYLRILAPEGSVYAFGNKKGMWAVEGEIRKHFDVLANITWKKTGTRASMANRESLTTFFTVSEVILLCVRKEGPIDGFESLREYLRGEWARAGLPYKRANDAVRSAGRWFTPGPRWGCPSGTTYERLQTYANLHGRQPPPPYADFHAVPRDGHRERYLDIDWARLKTEFATLRRPFDVAADRPFTDIWTYPNASGTGRHPAAKPPAMMHNIIRTSSRPGDLVADFFCGHGSALVAAAELGRRWVGGDICPEYVDVVRERMGEIQAHMPF